MADDMKARLDAAGGLAVDVMKEELSRLADRLRNLAPDVGEDAIKLLMRDAQLQLYPCVPAPPPGASAQQLADYERSLAERSTMFAEIGELEARLGAAQAAARAEAMATVERVLTRVGHIALTALLGLP